MFLACDLLVLTCTIPNLLEKQLEREYFQQSLCFEADCHCAVMCIVFVTRTCIAENISLSFFLYFGEKNIQLV